MVKSAAVFPRESQDNFDARGDILEKDDRSLAAQRFRQVSPVSDETFVSRIALRRLSTQLISDHFFGVVVTAANAINPKSASVGIPSREFRSKVEDLLTDLRQLIVETKTDDLVEVSVDQLRGAVEWDSKDRYRSLAAFVRDEKAQTSFTPAISGQDAPALFERLLAKADRTGPAVPNVCRRIWDNTYWWADPVCSRTLGALLWLCSNRNIEFHFRAKLTLIDLNAAALTRLNQRWEVLLCTESVREAVKHVARTLTMPVVCLPMPIAPMGLLKGFDTDIVELRNQNVSISDSLVCLPVDHPAATPLAKEIGHRSDVTDVLAGLPHLIESLPADDRIESQPLQVGEIPQQEYQLSLW
jgi:hypothetical protein